MNRVIFIYHHTQYLMEWNCMMMRSQYKPIRKFRIYPLQGRFFLFRQTVSEQTIDYHKASSYK